MIRRRRRMQGLFDMLVTLAIYLRFLAPPDGL